MKRFMLAAAFVLLTVTILRAESAPTAQQLLNTVLAKHSFFEAAPAPFVLEAEFTAQGNVPLKGHMRLRWRSKDQWWSRVEMQEFQQIRIRNGEMEYTLRNFAFTPLQVRDIFRLFDIDDDGIPVKPKRTFNLVEVGRELVCVEGETGGSAKELHQFCVDSESHDLVSHSWSDAPDQSRRQNFSDYAEANGMRYPRHLDMLMNSSRLVNLRVTNFQFTSFDLSLLEPPEGSIERHRCADLKRPVPSKKVDIDFGPRQGMTSQDTVVMTILTNGSVGEAYVIQSGGSNFDKKVVEALRNWKFKPATCGKVPVVDEVTVEVRFSRIARNRFRSFNSAPAAVVVVKIK